LNGNNIGYNNAAIYNDTDKMFDILLQSMKFIASSRFKVVKPFDNSRERGLPEFLIDRKQCIMIMK
jgi:hypothetical protein